MSGDVPEGWREAKLGEIATLSGGTTPPKANVGYWTEGTVPWATPSDITSLSQGQSRIASTETHIAEVALRECSLKLNPPGTVLMTSRATIGYAAINDVPIATNQGFLNFTCLDDSDPEFLCHWLNANRGLLTAAAGGSTFKELSRGTAKLLPILLPPLDEQRRIAEVLRSVDEAIHLNAGSIVGFKRLLAALRAELTYDADVPPAGTRSVSLHDLCRPRQHPTISSKQLTDSGYPTFGANGQIGFYTSYTHENPVIAITCRGATCGTINWIPAKSYLTGNAMALDDVRHDLINERYLFHYLSAWGVAKSIAGSAQPQITRQSLSGIKIAMPPMEEQVSIAAILDSSLTQLEAANFTYSTLLTTRSQVASDLLSGCVRVPA